MKEKKQYTAFYIEKSVRKKIRDIVENPNSMFDNESAFIRYCVKKVLVEVERELQGINKQEK
jgi:hypothetical protein